MNDNQAVVDRRGGKLQMPRSRGAASGFLLILLGVWGALVPFIGPYFHFAWGSTTAWDWTSARGWLEVLPGVAAVVGGLLLLTSRNRATAMLGGWLTVLAGAWFVIGRSLGESWHTGDVGKPLASTAGKFTALDLAYFSGLGVVIVFLGAVALGRLSVRTARDIRYADAHRPDSATHREPEPIADATTAEPVEPVAEPPRRGLRGLLRRNRDTTPVGR